MVVLVLMVVWLACAVAGYEIGRDKGREEAGLFLGLLLGLLGVVIIALMPPTEMSRRVDERLRLRREWELRQEWEREQEWNREQGEEERWEH